MFSILLAIFCAISIGLALEKDNEKGGRENVKQFTK